jgi:hypothetical protein
LLWSCCASGGGDKFLAKISSRFSAAAERVYGSRVPVLLVFLEARNLSTQADSINRAAARELREHNLQVLSGERRIETVSCVILGRHLSP